jgi:hypothetical protein
MACSCGLNATSDPQAGTFDIQSRVSGIQTWRAWSSPNNATPKLIVVAFLVHPKHLWVGGAKDSGTVTASVFESSQINSDLPAHGARQPDRRELSLMRRPALASLDMACHEPLAAKTVDDDCGLAAGSARGKVYHGRGLHL